MRRLAALPLLALIGATAPATSRTFLIGSFERLRVDGPYDVDVAAGPSPGARAEGPAAKVAALQLRVEGTTLIVSAGASGWIGSTAGEVPRLRVHVTAPSLSTVLVNGGGTVAVGTLKGERVELNLNGAGRLAIGRIDADQVIVTLTGTGDMALAGRTQALRIRSYGSGSIDAAGLDADEATVMSQSVRETRASARYSARVVALGGGAITVGGRGDCIVSGTAPVTCGGKIERR